MKTYAVVILIMLIAMCAANLQVAQSDNTQVITINADGSTSPSSAPISNTGNVYTFTADIQGQIVLERNNIVLDGAGHVLDDAGIGVGILLAGRTNVTIKNIKLTNFQTFNWSSNFAIKLSDSVGNSLYQNSFANNEFGIQLVNSSYNSVVENTFMNGYEPILVSTNSNLNNISANNMAKQVHGITVIASSNSNIVSSNDITDNQGSGIIVDSSSFNNFFANNVTNSHVGLETDFSSNNIFSANNVTKNFYGVYGASNNGNKFYHNSFINNSIQAYFYEPNHNSWDNGYFSGGNYWSDYNGTDANNDGIGDTPYIIDSNNQDRYPLIALASPRPSAIQTTASINLQPNLVGVGQTAQINMLISPPPPTSSDHFTGLILKITRPDGAVETRGPFNSDATGSQYVLYTPSQIGTYKLQLSYTGQFFTNINATYLSSSIAQATLTVQIEPIVSGSPSPTPSPPSTNTPTTTPGTLPALTPKPTKVPNTPVPPSPTAHVFPTPTFLFLQQDYGKQTQKTNFPVTAIVAMAAAVAIIILAMVMLRKLYSKAKQ